MIDSSKYSMDWDTFRDNADEAQKAFPIQDVLRIHFGLEPNRSGRCSCPIHGGTKPNLAIYPEENSVHCFSDCNESWNAITLVQADLKNHGMPDQGSYKEAFLTLCDEFGRDPLDFPGMRERNGQFREKPKPVQGKLEASMAGQNGTLMKKHLRLSRNPFFPMTYRTKEETKTLTLTTSEAASVFLDALNKRAPELEFLFNDLVKTLGEDMEDPNYRKIFQALLSPYTKILKEVRKLKPRKLSKEKTELIHSLVPMSPREKRNMTLSSLQSDPYWMCMSNGGKANPTDLPMMEIPIDQPFHLPKLFNDSAKKIIEKEFLIRVPTEEDVIISPDGTKKAVPILSFWADQTKDQVFAKMNHLYDLERVVQEEFTGFPEEFPVNQKAVDTILLKIDGKVRHCDQMLKVLDDLQDRLNKEVRSKVEAKEAKTEDKKEVSEEMPEPEPEIAR